MNADYHHVRVLLHEADDANSQIENFSDAMRGVGAIDVIEGSNGVYYTMMPGDWRFPAQQSVEATHDRVREIARPFCLWSSIIVLDYNHTHFSLDPIDYPGL